MTSWAGRIEQALRPLADDQRAEDMRAYMKGIAPFFGVPAPARRAATKPLGLPPDHELVAACRTLMLRPERELHYVATEALVKRARHLPPSLLDDLAWFIRTTSWWDTVDTLAHAVGAQVLAHPQLVPRMDEWICDADIWIARAAILHQLGFKQRTDPERLFRLCLVRAHETEFFLRKAIGWALRDYAWSEPEAVRSFLHEHGHELSALSRREAGKHL